MFEHTKLQFKRDPCKKCIVRACCTNFCEEKKEVIRRDTCYPVWFNRLLIIGLWLSIIALPITIIFDIIK